jgi:RNA-directed DNA polymerase
MAMGYGFAWLSSSSRKSAGGPILCAEMSTLSSLRSATTLKGLAKLLRFKPAGLSYILFKQPATAKYRVFQIPKRTGGTRTIKAPDKALKLLQKRLSDLLQDCLDEINTTTGRKDRIAHGFKRRRSIITNASQHRNRRYLFNVDLEDFFSSINFGRIRGYFIKNANFALNPAVATLIAQIACDGNGLPQGSPCSPVISNLIAHVLDIRLVRLASSVGCTYSRYADDLSFSTNKKQFPTQIAKPMADDSHVWKAGAELQKVVARSGFQINAGKTRMHYRTSRQVVTGLVVNSRLNVRSEYRHGVRAMVHRLLETGSFEAYFSTEEAGESLIAKRPGRPNQLHGMLGFIDSIDLYNKNRTTELQGSTGSSSSELMYRRFLIYTYLYAADLPVVICEGKTDNVYLTHAIRALASDFADLAEIGGQGKIRLKVRLFKYARSSTARVLGLNDGGSSSLASFIHTYKRETRKIKGPGKKNAVIILFDNDSGAKAIRSALNQTASVALKNNEPFVRVVDNLYAVPTPLVNDASESKIEDFFDANTKATEVGGKKFNPGNNFDTTKHYGKNIFAYQVVEKRAASIDFTGFRPLLSNLTAVLRSHATLMSGASTE